MEFRSYQRGRRTRPMRSVVCCVLRRSLRSEQALSPGPEVLSWEEVKCTEGKWEWGLGTQTFGSQTSPPPPPLPLIPPPSPPTQRVDTPRTDLFSWTNDSCAVLCARASHAPTAKPNTYCLLSCRNHRPIVLEGSSTM